jgi:SOS-response transcriptional repressor LexA
MRCLHQLLDDFCDININIRRRLSNKELIRVMIPRRDMRTADLAERLTLAIEACGKTRTQVAKEAGTSKATVTRLANGSETNPSKDLLVRLARVTGTTVGYLLGETTELPPDDVNELRRFQNWIAGKLPKIDARAEPNAVIIARKASQAATDRVAEGRQTTPFIPRDAEQTLRARGDSMINAGIIHDDLLYAAGAPKSPPIGRVIACRLGEEIYVKRLAVEHGRLILLSENSRYMPIEVEDDDSFEIIGVILRRTGNVT